VGPQIVLGILERVAIAALVIAALVGIVQYRLHKHTAKTQNNLQRRLAAIEEDRRSEELASRSAALIVCEEQKEPTSSGRLATWLVFRNAGEAVAREVWFERAPLVSLIPSDEEDRHPGLARVRNGKSSLTPQWAIQNGLAVAPRRARPRTPRCCTPLRIACLASTR
jgi:hypothetical protein